MRQYFEREYPSTTKSAHQWATPILNKLGNLLFDPGVRAIFQKRSTINFRQVLDEQKILLVNVPKGILGESLSSLLAAFIVAHLQKAALSRANSPSRPPFYLYLDEFQNYTTDNIADILSESRKYALSLILAHQYLQQLPDELRSAVLNTAGTIVSFRVGYKDAIELAKEIFPRPDFFEQTGFRPQIRVPWFLPISVGGDNKPKGWETPVRELASLQNRQFWTRKRGSHQPVKQQSYWMSDPQPTPELEDQIQVLRDESGKRYALPKSRAHGNVQHQVPEADLPLWTA